MAAFHPSPGPITTLSAAVRAPSKVTSLKLPPPDIIRIGRTSMPGWSMGTRSMVMPRCRSASGSVRASRKIQLAVSASDVQIFCPSITHSSSSSRARVRSPARSEPASVSEKPWHQRCSPLTIRGRK